MDSYSQSGSGGPQVNNPSVGIELNGWTEQHEEIFRNTWQLQEIIKQYTKYKKIPVITRNS